MYVEHKEGASTSHRAGARQDIARNLIQARYDSLKKQYQDAVTHRMTDGNADKILKQINDLIDKTSGELLLTSQGDDMKKDMTSFVDKASSERGASLTKSKEGLALLHQATMTMRDLEKYREYGAISRVQKTEIQLHDLAAQVENFRGTDPRFSLFLDRALPDALGARTRTASEAMHTPRTELIKRGSTKSLMSGGTDSPRSLAEHREDEYEKTWTKWMEKADNLNAEPAVVNDDSGADAVVAGNLFATLKEYSTTVRVFTSSTFTDTAVERNELMEHVYPFLKELCNKVGFAFQVVDMRWGVRSQTTTDHGTSELCISEVKKCLDMSVGPAFITFLGEKYGYRPFPRRIEAREFEMILEYLRAVRKKDVYLLTQWFKKDKNAVPSEYVLQPITVHLPEYVSPEDAKSSAAREEWWRLFSEMQDLLRQGSNALDDPKLTRKYFYSVTEEEIIHGVLESQARDTQAFAFYRSIPDLEAEDKVARQYMDVTTIGGEPARDPEAKKMLYELKNNAIPSVLSGENIHKFDLSDAYHPDNGIAVEDQMASQYITSYAKSVGSTLAEAILKARGKHKVVGDPLAIEVSRHVALVSEEARSYVTRGTLSAPVTDYLNKGNKGGVYVIHGAPGTGKTSLLSGALHAYAKKNTNAVVCVRLVGTTQESASCRGILKSLIRQIYRAYKLPAYKEPADILGIVSDFGKALELGTPTKPLIVAIDGIEEISATDRGKEYFWIPNVVAPNARLLLTTLSKDGPIEMVEHLKGQIHSNSSFQVLPALNQSDAENMISKWSRESRRTLTTFQKDALLTCLYTTPTPLYLTLACETALKWHSYDSDIELMDNVSGLINVMLTGLEGRHGKLLVSRALSNITVAKHGLSDLELEDVLSLDDEVLNHVFEWWTPPVRRIPSMLWIRIRKELGHYLSARGQHKVLAWTYRPWRKAIMQRYLKTEAARHARHTALIEYFDSRWSDEPKPFQGDQVQGLAYRYVAPQPLMHDGQEVNARRVAELPHSLEHAGMYHQLRECISDLDMFSVLYQSPEYRYELLRFWRVAEKEEPYAIATRVYEDQALSRALKANTDAERGASVDLLVLVGKFAIDVAEYNTAEVALDTAMKQEEAQQNGDYSQANLHELYNLLGYVQLALGQHAQAHVSYVKAQFLAGTNVLEKASSQLGTGDVHFAQGNLQEALTVWLEVEKALSALLAQASHSSGDASGQSAQAVDLRAEVLNKLGKVNRWLSKFTEAEKFAKQCVEISELHFGARHIRYAQAVHSLAELFRQLGKYKDAEPLYQEAVSTSRKLLGANHPDYAELLNGLAGCYRELGLYEKALPLYQDILRIRENAFEPNHPDVAYAFNNLGVIYTKLSKFKDAIPLLRKATDLRESIFGLENVNTVWSMYVLAKAVRLNGDADAALPLYETVLDVREKLLGEEHESVAEAHNGLAGCSRDLGNLDAMIKHYERALAIREKTFGERHPDTAYSCGSLGEAYALIDQLDKALPLLRKAVGLREELLGHKHPFTAWSIHALAAVQKQASQFEEAQKSFEEAYAIRKEVLGEEHAHTSLSLYGLADCIRDQGKSKEAIPLYEQGIDINTRVYGKEHPQVANGLDKLGVVNCMLSNYDDARVQLSEALALRVKVLEANHPDTAKSYHNYGRLMSAVGELEKAAESQDKALKMFEKTLGPSHTRVASCLDALGSITRDSDKLKEALSYYERALVIREKLHGKKHTQVAYSQGNLANIYYRIGDYDLALTMAQYAADTRLELQGGDHPAYAWTLNMLGEIHKANGNLEKAEKYYRDALAIRLSVLGEKHLSTSESLNNLGGLLRDRGDYESAAQTYRRSLSILEHIFDDEPYHAKISYVVTNLGEVECRMVNYEKALALLSRAVESRVKHKGEEHSDTAWSRMILAELYIQMKEDNKATNALALVTPVFQRVFGEQHLNYARVLHSHGILLRRGGDPGGARGAFIAELDILSETLPADHVRCKQAQAALDSL